MSFERRERHRSGVVDGHPGGRADQGRPDHTSAAQTAKIGEQRQSDAHENHHQPAEHVELGVEVDDHATRVAAAIQQVVHGGDGLHRPLQRPDGERGAAGEHEQARRPARAPEAADEDSEQQPEGREHRDSSGHDQIRME